MPFEFELDIPFHSTNFLTFVFNFSFEDDGGRRINVEGLEHDWNGNRAIIAELLGEFLEVVRISARASCCSASISSDIPQLILCTCECHFDLVA
nr:hypothetical protein [Saliphagus infecundisoli]